MTDNDPNAHVDRIAGFFERFSPADLDRLQTAYTGESFFKDPFNEVRGLPAIRRVYAHMFDALQEPRFVIVNRLAGRQECWLAWEFSFRLKTWRKNETQVVRGASHLLLDSEGLIRSHRDYWDAAEELYEKFPVLGGFLRWLKGKMRA